MRAIDAIGACVETEGVPAVPLIEHMSKLLKGSVKGILDGMETGAIGDLKPIRTSLPRPPLSYRRTVESEEL